MGACAQNKRVGIMLDDFVPENQTQLSIGNRINHPKHQKLMQLADHLDEKMGKGTLRLASQLGTEKWKMKQQHLSPAYTYRLSELPIVWAR